MEEEPSSISGGMTNLSGEASDSNSINYQVYNKRARYNTTEPSSRFKGVVRQQNGNWGAQIYTRHQRIWLGTFKSEKEAAMAYDSAAIRLRTGDSNRNFLWTNITVHEPKFQSQFTTEAILRMIKDGSYSFKYEDYLNERLQDSPTSAVLNADGAKALFQKELTPSDVGKLNRLVIPRKFAVKYFPQISDATNQSEGSGGVDNGELLFFDRSMRSWKFRYCYWNSSQSFVFTRGWNKFVKEKGLKAKDLVIFSTCECKNETKESQAVGIIDVGYHDVGNNGAVGYINEDEEALRLNARQTLIGSDHFDKVDRMSSKLNHRRNDDEEDFLQLKVGQILIESLDSNKDEEMSSNPDYGLSTDGCGNENSSEEEHVKTETGTQKKGLRIFGVQVA